MTRATAPSTSAPKPAPPGEPSPTRTRTTHGPGPSSGRRRKPRQRRQRGAAGCRGATERCTRNLQEISTAPQAWCPTIRTLEGSSSWLHSRDREAGEAASRRFRELAQLGGLQLASTCRRVFAVGGQKLP